MPSFWKHVNQVLREAQIIIEVLDARMIEETRNVEIEDKIRRLKKQILYGVTKCDLTNLDELKLKIKALQPSVFISCRERLGTTILKKKILELSHGEPVIVGVVGYPNVGKSSLINALAGRAAARTSAESGFTKGLQKIRINSKIILLDTPGVFPKGKADSANYGKTGVIDYAKIKEPEIAALQLIKEERELILAHYQMEDKQMVDQQMRNYFTTDELTIGTRESPADRMDAEEILIKLAFKWNKLQKGGKPDLEAAARQLLKEWQTGKILCRDFSV